MRGIIQKRAANVTIHLICIARRASAERGSPSRSAMMTRGGAGPASVAGGFAHSIGSIISERCGRNSKPIHIQLGRLPHAGRPRCGDPRDGDARRSISEAVSRDQGEAKAAEDSRRRAEGSGQVAHDDAARRVLAEITSAKRTFVARGQRNEIDQINQGASGRGATDAGIRAKGGRETGGAERGGGARAESYLPAALSEE